MSAADGVPGGPPDTGRPPRVFLSVAGTDLGWGEWIDRQLRRAGFEVEFYTRSFPVGANFVASVNTALARSDRMIAVLSPGYCDPGSWVTEEWQAAVQIAHSRPGFILPVLVERCQLPPLLAGLNHVDIVGLDEDTAAARVVRALSGDRRGDDAEPAFPGGAALPGGAAGAVDDLPAPPPRQARTAITVLHLTDLIAGHTAASEPYGAALRADLDRLAADERFTPDLLVVSGVAATGRKAEYAVAAGLIAEITGQLGLPAHRVAIVPGRGDVSAASCRTYFAACEEDETEPVRPYWRKWRQFVDFFDAYYRNAAGQTDAGAPTFAVGQEWTLFPLPDLRVVVAGLNSTMAMSHRREDDRGEVGGTQAEWFAERLAGYERRGWLRLAAGYHPPAAGGGFDTRTLPDADAVDLALGRHLNLLVAGHGHDGAATTPQDAEAARAGRHQAGRARFYARSVEPARLRRSGASVVACHADSGAAASGGAASGAVPSEAAGAGAARTVRYQLLQLDRQGLTRWDRRFSTRSGDWRPERRHGPDGRASYRLRWQSASAPFPREAHPGDRRGAAGTRAGSAGTGAGIRPGAGSGMAGDEGPEQGDGLDELGDRVVESFADRVAQITRLRHRDARISLIAAAGHTPAYLRVTVADGPVVEQRPVGVHGDGADAQVVDAFVEHVHSAYAATDQQLVSDFVYGGPSAEAGLVRYAQARGVRLRSFVEYQGLLDLRDYVRRQTAALEVDRLYPPSLYLPQRYRLIGDTGGDEPGGSDEVRTDLLSQVVDWLTSDVARFVLLLGDFGRGKTFLLHELARTLPRLRPQLVPVLVDLRRMEKAHTVDELIASHLVAAGEDRFDVRAFRYMLRSGRIVLLFDGFDELALRVTYETAAEHLGRLLDAVDGQAKIVVTSRTQHFLSHGQVRSALGARVELLPASRLAEVEDFTDDQIREFLVRLYDGDAERAASRLDLVHNIRDLLGLSRNPRMLGFIAALEESQLRAARTGSGTITSADLYRTLIDSWLRFEENRARPRGAAPTLTAGERLGAVTALALRLWQTTDRLISMSELAGTTSTALATMLTPTSASRSERGLDENQAAHMIGSGTLLVRTEDGGFTFIHQSVMEYLVAAAAAGRSGGSGGSGLLGGSGRGPAARDAIDADVLATRVMSPLMVDFFRGMAGRARAAGWARGVLADQGASAAARLNALAVACVTDRSASRGARLAGALLTGADLGDLDLSGADLSGADLTAARLVRSDLTGATLLGARMAGARLEQVTLTGADLGEADLTGARIVECDLTGAAVTDSSWSRTALLDCALDGHAAASAELSAAAIPGRDPASAQVDPAGPACAAVYSPDGTHLAYGTGSAVVILDAASGLRAATLTGHGSRVWAIAFSPDGRTLASASDDRTCRIWDVATGVTARTLDIYAAPTQSVTWLSDGRLAVVRRRGPLCLVNAVDGAVTESSAGAGAVRSVVSSPDSRFAATGNGDGSADLWAVTAGSVAPHVIASVGGHHGTVDALAFAPDGATLATGGRDGTVRLWDLEAGCAELRSISRNVPVVSLAFSPDGRQLAVGCRDRVACLWDLVSGDRTDLPREHLDWIWTVAFSPDGKHLVTGSGDGTVRQWDAASGVPSAVFTSRAEWVWAVAFSPDGRHVAAGGDGAVTLWDTATGTRAAVLRGHTGPVRAVEFSRDGSSLAASGGDGTVRLWDTATGTQTATLAGDAEGLFPLAFAPGRRLVTASGSSAHIWDTDTRKKLERVAVPFDVLTVAFSPDGGILALAGTDGGVLLVDLATGRRTELATDAASSIWCVRFSPDGSRMVGCGGDRTVLSWDTATADLRHVLTGHAGSVRSVAYSPDGALLASGGVDATVRLWDAEEGTPTAALTGHAGTVRSVAFSPDGSLLACGGDDGTTRLWDVGATTQVAAFTSFRGGGSAALFPDGSYKLDGDPSGALWWSMKQCRFEPGELDPYISAIRRLAAGAPIPAPAAGGRRG